jgi:HEAT repeats/Putative zinc-finger
MTCEQIGGVIADYVVGALDDVEQALVEVHAQQCVSCRQEIDLWQKLELLPAEEPSVDLRLRFDQMLATDGESQGARFPRFKKRIWPTWMHPIPLRSWVLRVVMALLCLIVGFWAGRYGSDHAESRHELAAMRSKLTNLHQSIALMLMQEQSASERLRGVTLSLHEKQPGSTVLSALLYTLRHDPSVDVRLAALDAVSRCQDQQVVRDGLVEALKGQQSPLVQVALIDLMVDLKESSVLPTLQRLAKDQTLNQTVRQRAVWAIQRLS